MSLLSRHLPEPSFIERDPAKITREMIATYERYTGKTLYPAQIERLLIDLIAYRESLVREAFQDGAKLNLVRYSRGVILDLIGENVGVARVAAIPARTVLRFTFFPVPATDAVLPQGSEVEGGGVSFTTTNDITVASGSASVDVMATCTQAGVIGNGFVPGQIRTLIGTPADLVVANVENVTTSEGGAEIETDERFKERIVAAPETFSVAGSVEAYRFHAMTAHPDIVDVAVISHTPGAVTLYPLTSVGQPSEAIKASVLETCSGEKVRPLCDNVFVCDPVPVDYEIDAQIVLINTADATLAHTQAEKAAMEFRDSQFSFGSAIIRSQIISALHIYGVHSVTLAQPASDLELEKWEWPRCTGINVTVTGVARG